MGWSWHPLGPLGLAAAVVGFALAAGVLFAAPQSAQNRRLAVLLYLEATLSLAAAGLLALTDAAGTAHALHAVAVVVLLALPWAYLRFAATLDAPLARPLRGPIVDAVLVAEALLLPLAWFVWPERFVVVAGLADWMPLRAAYGPWWVLAQALFAGLGMIAVLVAFQSQRHAHTRLGHRQATAVSIGLTLRTLFALGLVAVALTSDPLATAALWSVGLPVVHLMALPVLAYGLLSSQLFDLDIRIKAGMQRTLILGAFLGVVVLAGELAENWLSEGLSRGLTIAAAVVLAVLLRPVERLVDRIVDRIVPNVDGDDAAYVRARKEEVFRAAAEAAILGSAGPDEQAALERLGSRLGLEPDRRQAICTEVRALR